MFTPVKAAAVWFDRVMVTVEGFPAVIVEGEIAFATVSSPVTVRLVLTVVGLETFWSSCRLPAGMEFVKVEDPAVAGVVTVKTILQVPGFPGVPVGIVAPVSVTWFNPGL